MGKEVNGYILNITPDNIVDRDDYVNKIVSIVNNQCSSNIVIISAASAIGKSALVSKILNCNEFAQTIIRIHTLPINDSDQIDEWEYFKLIFDAVRDKYKNDGNLSFTAYIDSFKNNTNNKILLSYITDNVFSNMSNMSPIIPIVYVVANWYLKLGRFDINYLIEDNSIQSRRIKFQYVKYVFSEQNIIFSMDNIQNIDKQSLLDLINLINDIPKRTSKFIFEYTITDEQSRNACHILGEKLSSTSVTTEIIPLKKLEKKYIADAVSKHMRVPNNNWDFNIKLQEHYEEKNSGNIREMLDFSLCYTGEKQEDNINKQYTLKNIISLPDDAKLVLSFIVNANGCISKEMLYKVSNNINLDTDKAIKILASKLIIEDSGEDYCLSHASIADEWNNATSIFENYNNIAFQELKNSYFYSIKILSRDNNIYDRAWLNLIYLFSKYEPKNLSDLFEFIDNDHKKLMSAQNAWNYIAQMIAVTQNNILNHQQLYYKFIRFCFESELYEEGYSIVELLLSNPTIESDSFLILNKAMYLSALDRHTENILFCENQITYYKVNSKTYFNLLLISLSSYRSLGMLDECLRIHDILLRNKELKKTYEWGYFLRLCEMYLNRDRSSNFLRKSVLFFENINDTVQAGKSLISYAYILASQGKLNHALKKINLAQLYLKEQRMGNHMFLVNKAAIYLLAGNYTEEVWELLCESEITATVPFDKLAIITNKLVWCIENRCTDRYQLLISDANEILGMEPDYHIHGLIYYNIYYLLKLQGNSACEEYLIKARAVKKYCKPIKARLDNSPTSETRFALTKPWHVCFLAYWTYDLNL